MFENVFLKRLELYFKVLFFYLFSTNIHFVTTKLKFLIPLFMKNCLYMPLENFTKVIAKLYFIYFKDNKSFKAAVSFIKINFYILFNHNIKNNFF